MQVKVDQREASVDVSNDPRYNLSFSGKKRFITGTMAIVEIPFSGEAMMFSFHPSRWSTAIPRARIELQTLVFEISGVNMEPEWVKKRIDENIALIEEYLKNLHSDVQCYHAGLFEATKTHIVDFPHFF